MCGQNCFPVTTKYRREFFCPLNGISIYVACGFVLAPFSLGRSMLAHSILSMGVDNVECSQALSCPHALSHALSRPYALFPSPCPIPVPMPYPRPHALPRLHCLSLSPCPIPMHYPHPCAPDLFLCPILVPMPYPRPHALSPSLCPIPVYQNPILCPHALLYPHVTQFSHLLRYMFYNYLSLPIRVFLAVKTALYLCSSLTGSRDFGKVNWS